VAGLQPMLMGIGDNREADQRCACFPELSELPHSGGVEAWCAPADQGRGAPPALYARQYL